MTIREENIFPTSKMQSKDIKKEERRRKEQEYIKPPPNADHRTLKKPNINAVKRETTRNEEKKKEIWIRCPQSNDIPHTLDPVLQPQFCALCPLIARSLSHAYHKVKYFGRKKQMLFVCYMAAGAPSETVSDKLIRS